jgi:hypothetical protein
MRIKYILFIIFTTLVNIFFWYYVIVFCAVYVKSGEGWLTSSLQIIALQWFCFELIQPFGSALVRVLSKKFPSLS